MNPLAVHRDLVAAMRMPELIELEPGLCCAAFRLMKLLPAEYILARADADGLIGPGSLIVETSSGTFGLALAILCRMRGYRLILVGDHAINPALRQRMEELGATVELVAEPAAVGGIQRARLDRVDHYLREQPDAYWTRQYDNPIHGDAYDEFAERTLSALGRIDCVVGTVGSGGSMGGTVAALRRTNPELVAVGVDTFGSVLFGQPDCGRRFLRGLGNSLMPGNVRHAAFDEIHWVSAAEGFLAARELYRRHALFMGPTTGTAWMVARWWKREHPSARVLVLGPDDGNRYADTVYSDEWLGREGLELDALPGQPITVDDPRIAGPAWSRYAWARRSYVEVLGAPFSVPER